MNFVDDNMLALLLKIDTQHILFSYYNKIKLIVTLVQLLIMTIILCVGTLLAHYTGEIKYSLFTSIVLIFMYILLFINRYIIDFEYKKSEAKMKSLEERIDILSGKEVKENESK